MPVNNKYHIPKQLDLPKRKWPDKTLITSPLWCSVDLRDGNQALPNPLRPQQKLEYFELLTKIGFKQIEVAFPSGSQSDFDFCRKLIDDNLIPDDVFIMGLSQCREHLIERTMAALKNVKQAIVHLYIATSELHMKKVFGMSRQQTIDTAVKSVEYVKKLAKEMPESDLRLEFSPEEFTDTEPELALEICQAVFTTWGNATDSKPVIINLPATVERRPPNHYADLIEYFCGKFPERNKICVSVHSHNDQGMAVASTELAVMAGADRVEGTLFGHGERTGNVDLVTFANNLHSRGITTGLDFSNLDEISKTVERLTGMGIYYRQPYAGEYVFTAFSGSHQDAIRKGISSRRDEEPWQVPYLHIDPGDIGREYVKLIRINSQSGKGGVVWVLEHDYGISPPKGMHPQIGKEVQTLSERMDREITAAEVWELFQSKFINPAGPYKLIKYWPHPDNDDPTLIHGELQIEIKDKLQKISADGNGPISAFVNGLRKLGIKGFKVDDFDEEAVGHGADAKAIAYVPIKLNSGQTVWGVGSDTNIDQAAIHAIISGLNRAADNKIYKQA